MSIEIRNRVVLVACLLLAVAVYLADVYLTPESIFPAVPYVIPILIAAFFLSVGAVIGVAVFTIALQIVAALLHPGITPEWIWLLYTFDSVVVAVLAATLAVRMRREAALSEERGRLVEQLRETNGRLADANAEAQRRAEELRAVLEQMPSGVMIADASTGRIVMRNEQLQRIWHRQETTEEAGQRGEWSGRHLDGRPYERTERPLVRAMEVGEVVLGEEVAIVRDDGTKGVIQVNAAPIRDPEGHITGGVIVISDVTERKEAEREREKLLQGLQQANDQLMVTSARARASAEIAERRAAELDATFASIPDGIIVYNADGEIARMNPAAESLFGYSAEDKTRPLAERIAPMRIETPEGKPFPAEEMPIARALRGETSRGVVTAIHSRSGETRWIANSAAPIRGTNGRAAGAVAIFTDISELHELQEQQKDILHTVSHDLRAPLTIILGHARILERTLEGESPARKNVGVIVTSALRMNSMIQDLVDSARLGSGQIRLQRESVDPRRFALDLVERLYGGREGKRIRVEAPEGLPAIWADPGALERILTNLLSNALRYSEPDSQVTVEMAERGGELVTSVVDHGRGVAPEEIPLLFKRYGRTQAGREHRESLGLGLYIVKGLVTAQGGRVWVESELGRGSSFSFTVPLSHPPTPSPLGRGAPDSSRLPHGEGERPDSRHQGA